MNNNLYPVSEPLVVDEYWRFQTLLDNVHHSGGFLLVSSNCKDEHRVSEIHFDISHADRPGLQDLDNLINMLKDMRTELILMAANSIGRPYQGERFF